MPSAVFRYDKLDWEKLLVKPSMANEGDVGFSIPYRESKRGVNGLGIPNILPALVPLLLNNPLAQHFIRTGANVVSDVLFKNKPVKEAIEERGDESLRKLGFGRRRAKRGKIDIIGILEQKEDEREDSVPPKQQRCKVVRDVRFSLKP